MAKFGRSHFDGNKDVQQEEPVKINTFRCFAIGCPMPGVVYYNGEENGSCGWHLHTKGDDIPKVTKALKDWECIVLPIKALRRLLTHPDTCANVPEHNKAMRHYASTIRQATEGIEDLHDRTKPKEGELIGQWLQRLEYFLSARVKEALTGHIVDETQPTMATAEIRAGLRKVPLKAGQ